MKAADKYIAYVKKEVMEHPQKGWNRMCIGFKANKLRMRLAPGRNLAKGYQRLEQMMMGLVADSLGKESSYVWGNIFAPCEIMQCFGLKTLSVECLSCYFSGYHLEDYFIDCAQNGGIAQTLCSYHKTFVGAAECGALKAPKYAVTTSLSCDGNLNTFRYLQKKMGVPFTLLDVPYDEGEESVQYLAGQLKSLVAALEETFGRRFHEEELQEILRRENETRRLLLEFFTLQRDHFYPGELVSQLYLMMGTHLMMGTQEFLEEVRFLVEDIKKAPPFTGKRILWVHLLPFYQETLREYFNENERYQVMASDIVVDYLEEMDAARPFEALALKIIRNVFNGSYRHKTEVIGRLARLVQPEAVIHFCHWGCKQAAGGSILLKEKMQEMGIPMLILDGDGIDKRNSHDGQIKTRLEAFLELLEADSCGEKACDKREAEG